MNYNIKLIAIDMDGTLLDSKGEISEENKKTIRAAQENGVVVAICTGRFSENASMVIDDAGLFCPVVALNGAAFSLEPFSNPIVKNMMEAKTVKAVFDILEKHKADYFMFLPKKVITRRIGDAHHSELSQGQRLREKCGVIYLQGYEAAKENAENQIYKFFVYNKHNSCDLEALKEELTDVEGIYTTCSGKNSVEIMPLGVDKGLGIEMLCRHFSVSMRDCMAIGDYDNDLSMIERAGLGVAMENSIDELKKKSKFVTLNNDLDGVAHAIRTFVPLPNNR